MAERETTRTTGSGATAAKGSDRGGANIWPWVIAALVVAALVIGAVWLLADDDNGILDDDDNGNGTTTTQVEDDPATQPGAEDDGAGMGEPDEAETGAGTG
jgi:hypothetical protein